jgi:hypothetical protein
MSDQTDYYTGYAPLSTTPVVKDTPIAAGCRALYIGTAGTVVGRLKGDGADRTWKNAPAGGYLLGAFVLVKAASTADDMLANF